MRGADAGEIGLWRKIAWFGLLTVFAGCVATEQIPTGQSLYARIGEKPVISVAVEQRVDNVLANAKINGRFVTTDIRKLKGHLVEHVCMAT